MALFLVTNPSAIKNANPIYIRYFELRINQPDKSPDGQISPLIPLFAFHSLMPRSCGTSLALLLGDECLCLMHGDPGERGAFSGERAALFQTRTSA
jgi:hypothetical protein